MHSTGILDYDKLLAGRPLTTSNLAPLLELVATRGVTHYAPLRYCTGGLFRLQKLCGPKRSCLRDILEIIAPKWICRKCTQGKVIAHATAVVQMTHSPSIGHCIWFDRYLGVLWPIICCKWYITISPEMVNQQFMSFKLLCKHLSVLCTCISETK